MKQLRGPDRATLGLWLDLNRAHRQRTDRALAEVLRFDAQGVIKARTVIFPCDRGSELDQLGFGKVRAQTRK